MIEALQKSDSSMFTKCIDHGSNPNQVLESEKGNSMILILILAVIHYVAKQGNLKSLEILLGKDVDLDVLNKDKESALVIKLYLLFILNCSSYVLNKKISQW